MSIAREVIVDLLPLYVAGEASPASRALVEEYLKNDPELAARVQKLGTDELATTPSANLPAEVEVRSLRRTRRLLAAQRWLFGLGIALVAAPLGLRIDFDRGGITTFRFLVLDKPYVLGPLLVLGMGCWIGYVMLKRRLRTGERSGTG